VSRFCGSDLWSEVLKLAKRRGAKRVAVAYYSTDSHLHCGSGDTIIVDASTKAVTTRQTSPTVLLAAVRRGARVYSHAKLHAKIIHSDNCAIVGSANLSTTSRVLREAGVLVTDRRQLNDIGQYLDRLQAEASLLLEPDIRRLCAIPLDPVRPGVSIARKPSLLEAIAAGLPSLDTVSFSWYTGETGLGEAEVARQARRRGVYLPEGNEWSWFEGLNTRGALSKTRRLCRDRPMVCWEGTTDGAGQLSTFKAHEPRASAFIDAFALEGRVVSIIGQRPFATSFDLRRDRKQLARILSAGLRRASRRIRAAVNDSVGVITTPHLMEIYRLGRKAG